ncbi:Mur ligase family protein [Natronincola ferrireducens]|uniref:UDP-N-acetylmuramoyl-tripeptide--D-alanyl-D-alanine ligase n=1 Tax=Natronincola ferrireducens TaxID=393762 RepID=A0A1G9EA87_9FIRM|nr:UDP-N-acetylmuramoyl-tripeptide--D-alanyl-D-alanine ligase [Natronincola ferrireducens]SDK72998.1 UDP-N-acetylmuramoyl-tripeptide--D-alanyl-D-alanine ligase [Natronincola ferrireducens]
MKTLVLGDILKAIEGELIFGDEKFIIKSVKKRPKVFKKGTLYFHFHKRHPITSEFNLNKQSIVIVSEQTFDDEELGNTGMLVKVENIKESYEKFLDYYRSLFNIPVVGITGTAGKTTTKEMLTHILSIDRKVQSTKRSLNAVALNDQYLLGIDDETEAAVIEMGVSYPGNLRNTGKIFKPQIGIITNIGIAHLEGCKTFEAYLQAKAEMLQALSYGGKLILNADDDNIKLIDLSSFQGDVIYFGQGAACHYRACNIQYCDRGLEFQLHCEDDTYSAFISGLGYHNVYNALAAIAAAHSLGIEIQVILNRLRSFKHLERHNTIYTGLHEATIIDDTWNSNPTSAYAALKVLKEIANGKRTIAILGKLQRLGKQEEAEYVKMGEYLAMSGIDILITVEKEAELMGQVALEKGMDISNVLFAYSAEEVEKILSYLLNKNTIALFKMSLDKMNPSYRKLLQKICKE